MADSIEPGQLRERLGLDTAPAGLVSTQAVLSPATARPLLNLRQRQTAIQACNPELAAELSTEVATVHRKLLLVVPALCPLPIAPWRCGAWLLLCPGTLPVCAGHELSGAAAPRALSDRSARS